MSAWENKGQVIATSEDYKCLVQPNFNCKILHDATPCSLVHRYLFRTCLIFHHFWKWKTIDASSSSVYINQPNYTASFWRWTGHLSNSAFVIIIRNSENHWNLGKRPTACFPNAVFKFSEHSVAVFLKLKQNVIKLPCSRKSVILIIAYRTFHFLIEARVASHKLRTESCLSAL
jgi:hypothetical protein